VNTVWMSCSATSLDYRLASFTEVSVILMCNGETKQQSTWKIRPIFHEEDVVYGKYPLDVFLAKYQEKYPSQDPAKACKAFKTEQGTHYLYSPDTLKYIGASNPEDLLRDSISPIDFAQSLLEELGNEKWTLVAHGLEYIGNLLEAYFSRIGHWDRLNEVLNAKGGIDTVQFFRLTNAIHNKTYSVSLPALAKTQGLELDSTSAKSKISCLAKLVESSLFAL